MTCADWRVVWNHLDRMANQGTELPDAAPGGRKRSDFGLATTRLNCPAT
jgi:hypothetical protein